MNMRRWGMIAVLALSLSIAYSGSTAYGGQGTSGKEDHVPVIVVLHKGENPDVAAREASENGASITKVYRHALIGFAGSIPRQRLENLRRNPRVAHVEPDRLVWSLAQPLPTGVDRIEGDQNSIAQIDGVDTRVNADIAIIDTGIDNIHPDLNVFRTVNCARFFGCLENQGTDGNGHGTHVAGIAAAIDNDIGVVGVAPGARLWSVKVLDDRGSGYLSWVIAGIDWVTARSIVIDVANVSLGWQGNSLATRSAIQNSVAQGVVYVVAAGNSSQDVYGADGLPGTSDDFEPASYPEVASIAALSDTDGQSGGVGPFSSWTGADRNGDGVDDGVDDSFAWFSNFSFTAASDNPVVSPGNAIDLILPGVDIYSTWKGGNYNTIGGTSMASPHAAGLAALYVAENGRDANGDGSVNQSDVYAIRQALIDGGMAQDDSYGLSVLNDPDSAHENLGWAVAIGPIGSVNVPPVADNDSAATDEDASVTIDLLANDADADGDPLSVTNLTQPAAGTAVLNPDNTVTYTPNADYSGLDRFVYTANDGSADSNQAFVTVTVNPVNDPPVAADDSATTTEEAPVTLYVLDNDTDADGDPPSVSNLTQPAAGTDVLNVSIEMRNNPTPGQNARIYVWVTNSSGNPVAYAGVSLTVDTAGSDYSRTGNTNTDGRARFRVKTRSSDGLPWVITAVASYGSDTGSDVIIYDGP